MNTESFATHFKKAMVRNFPLSGHELFDYNHNIYIQSEDTRPFEKVSIVIDTEVGRENAANIIKVLCGTLKKRPFSHSTRYVLALWGGESIQYQPPLSVYKLEAGFEQLTWTGNETGGLEALSPSMDRLYRASEWTILITSYEKLTASKLDRFPYARRSFVVYPDTEESKTPQKLLHTPCFGLDMPNRGPQSVIGKFIKEKEKEKMKHRHLDETFMEALKYGELKPLLDAVREDDTLCMELRGDSVNIYYRGGSLFKISQKDSNYILSFDTNYTEGKMSLSHNPSISEAVGEIPFYKQAMDYYFHAHPHYEREFQQTILRENNNSGNISRATDYYIVDIEYAEADARFDMVAFKWISNGAARKNTKKLSLALVEVKYGDGALDGAAGIKKHLKDFNEFLGDKENLNLFRNDMEIVFKQKCELGLMDGLQEHQFDVKLTEEVETIFIFANHDPDSKKLDKLLDSIDWADYQSFPVYAACSSKMGYGLYVDCLQDLKKQ